MAIKDITSYYHVNAGKYHVLTEEQCEKIIETALNIMEKTGIMIKNNNVEEFFINAGCTVEGELVKFPKSLVKDCIASAASELVLYDRFGNEVIRAGGTNNYYGNGPTNPMYNDFETGQRREALRQDVANNVKVSDACPNIDFIMGLAGISDCDPEIADVVEASEMLKNTTKPIIAWGNSVEGFKEQVAMGAAVAGGLDKLVEKPFMAIFPGCPVTPLCIDGENFDKMKYAAEIGLPIIWPTGPQLGSTSPVTIAAGISVGLAEVLTGLVFSQLVKRGSAIACGIVIVSVDMATTQSAYGSPEHCLGEGAVADIFHYFNLPMFQTGGVTEAKQADEQAAIEASMQILTNALSGGHLVHDVGFLDGAMSASLEQIVLCDEIIGYARRVARGFDVDDDSLAFDLIHQVGPGGEFLTDEHTFMNFRKELWQPTLIDRSRYQSWIQNPTDMRTRVHEKAKRILAEHQVPPLSDEALQAIDEILTKAQKRVSQ
ncbi:MAG: trimethylamine methyltransferase family protein [Bacillota bacterium]|nr:trimethylamine methyltransferase family protein [Bacillota bacterium]